MDKLLTLRRIKKKNIYIYIDTHTHTYANACVYITHSLSLFSLSLASSLELSHLPRGRMHEPSLSFSLFICFVFFHLSQPRSTWSLCILESLCSIDVDLEIVCVFHPDTPSLLLSRQALSISFPLCLAFSLSLSLSHPSWSSFSPHSLPGPHPPSGFVDCFLCICHLSTYPSIFQLTLFLSRFFPSLSLSLSLSLSRPLSHVRKQLS